MNDAEIEIVDRFDLIKNDLISWGKVVDDNIVKILKKNNLDKEIKIFPVSRLKEDKSFLSKALWRNKPYKDPLIEIEDKIATRVVLLKTDDILPAAQYILQSSEWVSKITKGLHEGIEDKPREFDYQSMHIVVSPNRGDLIFKEEVRAFLTCEIQIRTLLQHAFAEVSHDSTYKGPYKNDVEIIRRLSKAMALMEATDDYFCDIFNLMQDQTRKFGNYLKELTRLFLKFNASFEQKNIDIQLTDIFFGLLVKKEVPIQDLEEFISKESAIFKEAINNNESYIFKQPVILLIGYYAFNRRNFLKEDWPLSYENFVEIFNGFNLNVEDV